MKPPDGELVRTVLLLIATYGGQYHRRQDLPLVLQHFSIGVYQHNTVGSEPNKFHIPDALTPLFNYINATGRFRSIYGSLNDPLADDSAT